MTTNSKTPDMTLSSTFFLSDCVSFLKFRKWSMFHINIMAGSVVMIIFIYKEFDQKFGN